MRYFLSAGEASGDLHGAGLITALKEIDPQAVFCFMGGDRMEKASGGVKPIFHYKEISFMGILPVIKHLSKIKDCARIQQQKILEFNPDVVIPIDYPSFHLHYILPFVKKNLSCPIIYYIAPKLWAWKKYRIKKLKKYVDLQLSILPFEEQFFSQYDYPCIYVGNPSVDAIEASSFKGAAIENNDSNTLAILPGSRIEEIKTNLPLLLKVAQEYSNYHIIIAGAPGRKKEDYSKILANYPNAELQFNSTFNILSKSKAALVTSGTATLETALIGVPQVVAYYVKGGVLANFIFNHFFPIKYISLVNLIVGKEIVKELFAANFTQKKLSEAIRPLLSNTIERQNMLKEYLHLSEILGSCGAAKRAAKIIYDKINTIH